MFIRTAFFRASLALALTLAAATSARAQNISVEVANMRQELDLMVQRVGQLEVTVEALRRENTDLRDKASAGKQNYATVSQLNESVATLNKSIRDSKSDTLARVDSEMKKLVKDTNAALDQMAKAVNTRTRGVSSSSAAQTGGQQQAPAFSENYPKEGISYTVQSGDNIGRIAQKTGAKTKDIINANRIADVTKLMPGQVLFIPGGKDAAPPAPPAPPASHTPAPNSPIAPGD